MLGLNGAMDGISSIARNVILKGGGMHTAFNGSGFKSMSQFASTISPKGKQEIFEEVFSAVRPGSAIRPGRVNMKPPTVGRLPEAKAPVRSWGEALGTGVRGVYDKLRAGAGPAWASAKEAGTQAWNGAAGTSASSMWKGAAPLVRKGLYGAAAGGVAGYLGNQFAPNIATADSPFSSALRMGALGAGIGAMGAIGKSLVKTNEVNAINPWLLKGAKMTSKVADSKVTTKALMAGGVYGSMNFNFTKPRNPNGTSRR